MANAIPITAPVAATPIVDTALAAALAKDKVAPVGTKPAPAEPANLLEASRDAAIAGGAHSASIEGGGKFLRVNH